MPPLAVCQKIDLLWTKQCMCVWCCMPVTGYVDKVNLNNRDGELQPQTSGTQKLTVDEEKRKCSFIQRVPTRICVHVFVFTAVSVFSYTPLCVRAWVCVCHANTPQWLVCEVTDSFIMACAHRETAPARGRRKEERDSGQARFTVGPAHISPAVSGGRGQLLSHLMSLWVFHQLSIYRAPSL